MIPSRLIQNAFGHWVLQDPKAAVEWFDKQPAEFADDNFYRHVTENTAWSNSELSTEWALKINDRAQRQKALKSLYYRVKRKGKVALAEWMKGLDLEDQDFLIRNDPKRN